MKKIWDDFIDSSNNGTMFHKQRFLSYHINRRFKNHSLLFYNKQKLVSVLPGTIINQVFYSHPGASFGSFVIKQNINFKCIQNIISSLEEYLINLQIRSVVLINTPNIYYSNPHESFNYLLSYNKYKIVERYISHFSNLKQFDTINTLINKRKYRYINKLIKNKTFDIVKSENFTSFYQILKKSKKKFNTKPTHSLEEIKKLHALFPNNIKLLITKKNNSIIGGVLLFYINKKTCLVFYNVVKNTEQKSQLASLQMYYAMLNAVQNRCTLIDFGVSHMPQLSNPLIPKPSLIQFKEHFGGQGCMREIYRKDLIC